MHVELLTATKREGQSKTTGRPWQLLELQGILHSDDGSQHVFVYDFWPPRGEALPDLKPGRYDVVTEIRPDNKTRKLMAEITRLVPAALKSVADSFTPATVAKVR